MQLFCSLVFAAEPTKMKCNSHSKLKKSVFRKLKTCKIPKPLNMPSVRKEFLFEIILIFQSIHILQRLDCLLENRICSAFSQIDGIVTEMFYVF